MVINKSVMKRKRKEGRAPSPLLDDSPKRTKVHAQRKFAQGSNVNSPAITPDKEIEREEIDIAPEPVELLPIKRPNTEDFLTFLCFRGTPVLPPSLNFFNTASIVDTNGQMHEIKSESPKNGPIDTSAIAKASERPFIAFGVRKRADPIVISRQMDKKRRHALALQTLRRKYQEQKMAKIRAVTISKLSEKVTSRSSTITKTESVTKKSNLVAKNKIEVTSIKRVKVAPQPVVKPLARAQIKPKMCLRSFRGRFVQKELQFRNVKKRTLPAKKLDDGKKTEIVEDKQDSDYTTEEEEEVEEKKEKKLVKKEVIAKVTKKSAPGPKKLPEISLRITRSNKVLNKISSRRQQIKQQLLSTPKTIVKPRTLRSQSQISSPEIKTRLMKLKLQKDNAKEAVVKKMIKKLEPTKKAEPKKDLQAAKKCKIIEVVKKEPSKTKSMLTKGDTEGNKLQLAKKALKVEPVSKPSRKNDELNDKEINQRPSRKTKEAAAIYMELLSQKLVNESKADDDEVSIDSFPELPNVKRTEQRENELKAKAKGKNVDSDSDTKKSCKGKDVEKKKVPDKKSGTPEKNVAKKEIVSSKKETVKSKKESETSGKKSETGKKKGEIKVSLSKTVPNEPKVERMVTRELTGKRKVKKIETSSESEISTKQQPKAHKSEEKSKAPDEKNQRQTRNSQNNRKRGDESDSDESFHADVRIPRKRQVTRSKNSKKETDEEEEKSVSSADKKPIKKSTRAAPTSYLECSLSESDQSITSNTRPPVKVIKQEKKVVNKPKKETKANQSFSDSDEEPLSKLTVSKPEDDKKKTVKPTKASKEVEIKVEEVGVKQKRECAKRPQNYLIMFSSSDEEFIEEPPVAKTPKIEPTYAQSFDLKDISRRFGKGKVNMSNEQIEKWLNDAAMAGSCVKSENDEMLKFGEKIPTETSFSVANLIDTEKLKTLLVNNDKSEFLSIEKKLDGESPKSTEEAKLKQSLDKKIIFRNKDRIVAKTNSKAFSANNESSVYAFGDDDDLMKAPFRRPSRRPSSATSRSEDELSKCEEASKSGHFRVPSAKLDLPKGKDDEELMGAESLKLKTSPRPPNAMVPPKCPKGLKPTKSGDTFEYKIPSSPSASSSSSMSKKQNQTKPQKPKELTAVNLPEFPLGSAAHLVEAPIFYPTDKEFQDPLEYIEKIRSKAEQFGICRIVPPSTFKPECKVTDDMRFTAYNQYVHKMYYRWGPNFREFMAIKKYLTTQNIIFTHPPWIGGMEIDLPRLYQTVQSLGGLKEVIEKKKWPKVSDLMKIPKLAQDRCTKLDDIYCKYLLPYDTLAPTERQKLFEEVDADWRKKTDKRRAAPAPNDSDESETDDESTECITRGRNMALNAFYRIARNTMSMWFKTSEPSAGEVEQEFWGHVTARDRHLCVHSGSIDSGGWGYGFAVTKNSPFARHAWNLKVLTNNGGSVLRALGPVMGVTVPTLHVGMVFSACCWYMDPHGLPWIEYLHTGGNKIWYGIPHTAGAQFEACMRKLAPNYCNEKGLWLASDTVMVPPDLLVENGVSLARTVQEPGQFVVVFPKVFTSNLSTGYVVSESVYFAGLEWLGGARTLFDELRNSCEPSMFSLDRLLVSIVDDPRSSVEVLRRIVPAVEALCSKEKKGRERLRELGVKEFEKLPLPDAMSKKKKKLQEDDGEYECDVCRMNLFVSMVSEEQEDGVYCLDHAIEEIGKKTIEAKNCKLSFTYDDGEVQGLIERNQEAIVNRLQKKVHSKYAGMPTLLTK